MEALSSVTHRNTQHSCMFSTEGVNFSLNCSPELKKALAEKFTKDKEAMKKYVNSLPTKSLVLSGVSPHGHLFTHVSGTNGSEFVNRDGMIPPRVKSPLSGLQSSKVTILQSCEGLILSIPSGLVRGRPEAGEEKGVWSKLPGICYVCNPTTLDVKELIPPPAASSGCMGLAFDPDRSHHYKVVCLSFQDRRVHVYSSECRSWRDFEMTIPLDESDSIGHPYTVEEYNSVYSRGALYWMNRRSGNGFWFNIENNELSRLGWPRTAEQDSNICYMGACAGNLYVVEKYSHNASHYILHEMSADGSVWVPKHRINFDQDVAPHLTRSPSMGSVDVLYIFQEKYGGLGIVFSTDVTIAYHLRRRTVKRFHLKGAPYRRAFAHFEILYFLPDK